MFLDVKELAVRKLRIRKSYAPGSIDFHSAEIKQMEPLEVNATAELLDGLGYQARVVDFSFFEFSELFNTKREQIARVEEHSDAYHLKFGSTDVMVAYLLEITRKSKDTPDR